MVLKFINFNFIVRIIRMKNKYLFIACLIFCLLFSITGISAAAGMDNNILNSSHDASLSVDSGISHSVVMANENKNTFKELNRTVSSSNDKEANAEASSYLQSYNGKGEVLNEQSNGKNVVSDSNAAGTFSELNELINNASAGGTVTLTKDYTYDSTSDSSYIDGISISKSLTIDGCGFTIDGNKQARMFDVIADNVNIINLKLTNGNTSYYGGAILWRTSDGAVSNCTFTGNTAKYSAAIFWAGLAHGTVSNCTFIGNTAEYGGAIQWESANGKLSNCTFIGNTAKYGGAICWHMFANGTVSNCTFIGNTAKYEGGAIYWNASANGTVTNCVFTNNTGELWGGGAVSWFNSTNGTVSNCTFTGNKASNDGGAIFWISANGTIANCTFMGNKAISTGSYKYGGGAIYWYDCENGTVTNCVFTNNTVEGLLGGAIYWLGRFGVVSNCTFINNTAVYGGAIFWNGYYGRISNSTFIDNVRESGDYCIFSDIKPAFENNTLYNIEATVTAAVLNNNVSVNVTYFGDTTDIYNEKKYINLTNEIGGDIVIVEGKFEATFPVLKAGVYFIYLADEYGNRYYMPNNRVVVPLDIVYVSPNGTGNGTSREDLANWTAGYAFADYNTTVIFTNGTYVIANFNIAKSLKIIGDGNATIDANKLGNIFNVKVDNVSINGINFINGEAEYGGAIYWKNVANGVVTNCTFTNNTAVYGGAIYWNASANGSVSNCTFSGNNATGFGGAISGTGAYVTVTNSSFSGNIAYFGGAILWDDTNGAVNNCTFTGNTVPREGGAIYWKDSGNGVVTNCTFSGNTAGEGGAIYWKGSGNGAVTNCTFTGNTATREGGAIYLFSFVYGTVTNCTFTANNATQNGGAIYWFDALNGKTTNCSFTGNKASNDGGAIYWHDALNGKTTNCSFTGNKASNDGGAIYWYDAVNGKTTNCSFTGNKASNDGGAIYVESAKNTTVTNSIFAGNTANNGGAIQWNNAQDGKIINSTFENNTGNYRNIYNNLYVANITDCTFKDVYVILDKKNYTYGSLNHLNAAVDYGVSNYTFNTTIKISFNGETPEEYDLNETKFNINITDFRPNEYEFVLYNFTDLNDNNYHILNRSNFNIDRFEINFTDINNVTVVYGANNTLDITGSFGTVGYGSNYTGPINIKIGDVSAEATVGDGVFNATLTGLGILDAAEHVILITGQNNTNFTVDEYQGLYNVTKATVNVIGFDNITVSYGANDTVNIEGDLSTVEYGSNYTGPMTVSIGTLSGICDVSNGHFNATLTGLGVLNVGEHEVNIHGDATDNFEFVDFTGLYNVSKATVNVVRFDNITVSYGANNTVNIEGDLSTVEYGSNYTGPMTVIINSINAPCDVTGGSFNATLTGLGALDVGEYELLIHGDDTDNFDFTNYTGLYNVTRAVIAVTQCDNISVFYSKNDTVNVIGSFTTVEFGSNYTGPVHVKIGNNVEGDATVSGGRFNITLSGLAEYGIGEYIINITGGDSTNFIFTEYNGLFNVTKAIIRVTSFENITVSYGKNDTVNIIGSLNTDEYAVGYDGTVTISIGGVSVDAAVVGNRFNGTLTGLGSLESREYCINITGTETANFIFTQYNGLYNITRASADIGDIAADAIHYGDRSLNIKGSIISNIIYGNNYTGNITLSIKGYDTKVTLKVNPDGSYLATMNSLPKLAVGKYTVIVSLLGDDGNYNATSREFADNLTVLIKDVNITLTGSAVKYGSAAIVKNNAGSDITAIVTYTITGKGFKKTVNQRAHDVLKLARLPVDTYTVTARCTDPNYNMTFNTAKVIVQNNGISIKAGNMKRAYNSGTDYKASLLNLNGKALSNTKVTVKVAGKTYSLKTDSKGVFKLNKKFRVGSYKIQITNPSTKESVSRTFKIVKRLTNNRNIASDFGRVGVFKVRAVADDGSAEKAGKTVAIKLNGVIYKCKTNAHGYASRKILLNPGKYNIVSSYKGYRVKNTYEVRHILRALTKSVSVSKSANRFIVKAQVKYSNGKTVKSRKVQFVFNNRKFISKTNSKGIATFVIGKNVIRKLKRSKTYTGRFKYLITVKNSRYGKYAGDTVTIKVKT